MSRQSGAIFAKSPLHHSFIAQKEALPIKATARLRASTTTDGGNSHPFSSAWSARAQSDTVDQRGSQSDLLG